MAEKIEDAEFRSDMKPLLATSAFQGDAFNKGSFQTGHAEYDPDTAYRQVHKALIELLPGDPWKVPKRAPERRAERRAKRRRISCISTVSRRGQQHPKAGPRDGSQG
jgi:hypothetical protein